MPESVTSLITAAQRGENGAAEQLFTEVRPYLGAIARTLLRKTPSAQIDASDAVQDALLKVVRKLAEFRGQSTEEWNKWLAITVTNEIRNRFRDALREKRDIRREQPIAVDPSLDYRRDDRLRPSQILMRREAAALLFAAIDRLPARQRHVVRLRSIEGLSFREVAAEIPCSEANARQLWTRAIRRLAEQFEDDTQLP